MGINIAIDGPAGAGKSTIARSLAKQLSYIYVDTGAMYRAMAYFMLTHGVGEDEIQQIARMSSQPDISIRYENGEQNVFLDGRNVSRYLRTEEVSRMASIVSAVPEVRAALLQLQRSLARKNDVVMDGRDIGTTILPDAQVKIYLTASAEVRALRRCLELEARGETCSREEVLAEIIDRDRRDMHREVSPLRQAPDAVVVDSSTLDADQVVAKIMEIIKKSIGEKEHTGK